MSLEARDLVTRGYIRRSNANRFMNDVQSALENASSKMSNTAPSTRTSN
jgi:polyhydroxyalkanoate synthesis regulator phasin